MKTLVRFCAAYNGSALIAFLVPGVLPSLGVEAPSSPLWRWLPALLAFFAATVLTIASRDLSRYGSFAYWNGLVRITFAVAALALRFDLSAGSFFGLLALGDLLLGLACIIALPKATGRSHLGLLLDGDSRSAGAETG